jgi:hypothetical protein
MATLLTPLIALIALYIAWQQFEINRRQHRLALFEKRLAVFNSTMQMISAVVQTANPTLAQCFQFIQDTRDHEFLFGTEVKKFVDEVYSKAVTLNSQIALGPNTAVQQTQVMGWFVNQMTEARRIFLPYMDFTKP